MMEVDEIKRGKTTFFIMLIGFSTFKSLRTSSEGMKIITTIFSCGLSPVERRYDDPP